jgi:hypothetical protein
LPEPLVPQLGDRELHLLDQQLAGAYLGLRIARLGLRLHALGLRLLARDVRGDHHRLERRDIVGERIRSGRHNAIAAQIIDVASSNRVVIHNAASNNSARRLRSPRVLRHPPVNAFEQITKLRRRDRHRPVRRRRPDKPSASGRLA